MNQSGLKPLAPAEWVVMQAVWDHEQREAEATAGEILERIAAQRDWHISTLKTTMDRLVRKGYLASRIRGNTCFYSAAVTREQATRQSVGSFLDMVLDGAVGPLVAYLADRKGLTAKETEELERLLEKRKGGKRS